MRDTTASVELLGQICAQFHLQNLTPQLNACSETLRSGGRVEVAVLGQFKAGKSSFLNTIIGSEIMPVNVLPATAVITRIGYGPTDRAVVHRLSGEIEEIPLAELPEYVTEQRNPRNEKRVALVEVELASLAPYRGICFVDTPGLGSIFAHNTQASMDWLPKVGGAIVAISANQPLGEQDLRLLGEVFKHTPEVVILLTKADLVSDRERKAVIEFTQWQIAQNTGGRQLLVLPFSNRPDFERFQNDVREYLLTNVAGRHEELFVKIMGHKLSALISECRAYLILAQTAAQSAEAARSELRDMIRREREGLDSLGKEIHVLTRDLKTRVRTAAGERFHDLHGELTKRLCASLKKAMGAWTGSLAKRTQAFQDWAARAFEEELGRVSEHGKGYLEEYLIEAQVSFHRTVRAFQDRLSKEIERALGISFESARFHAEIAAPRKPDVKMGQVFDSHIDLLWFAIPMGLFHRLFERHFLRLIPWEVEKNLSRLASQWADAVNASIDSLARQSMESIQNELATIEGLVSGVGDQCSAIETALRRLDECSECLAIPNGRGDAAAHFGNC
ncbi:MAG TPA: dynamin family protein [Candidatus Hydrogenedentes bacterium]|nr:dynamin family protein [Candidatus Hydrogenedentota bacterium]HOV74705.1 dynamin family protein [Candidatus Hydrogenedentota bacterium]HPC18521.1 dynamin family protein [Candidatus Hydrogenedentota bacterium]HRT22237.1 dynamin family protein [Candidatus Hydrogenedentota bacterium]HRT67000.1 dynamin family protein [Candidatus Hydrogenedentota bacterium]